MLMLFLEFSLAFIWEPNVGTYAEVGFLKDKVRRQLAARSMIGQTKA